MRTARKMRGWNQAELAEKAGVAERTVRNAEAGQLVELNVADCIAGALEINVSELIRADKETSQRKRWKKVIGELQQALAEAVIDQNFEPMKKLVHPQVEMHCYWDGNFGCHGVYHGHSGAVEYATRCHRSGS